MAVTNPANSQVEVAPATSAVFSDSINVRLINIDVFVTDRHGNPITNLNIEDFEVFENGKPVAISHFAVVGTPAKTVTNEDAMVKAITGIPSPEMHPPPTPAEEGLLPHLVVAFDSMHLTHLAKRRMMGGMRQYLEETSIPRDQVMIMNLDRHQSHGFDVVVPFGSTLEDLEEGLQRIKKMAPGGRRVTNAYRILLDRLTQTHMEYRRRDVFRPGGGGPNPTQIPFKSVARSDRNGALKSNRIRIRRPSA